MEPKQIAQKWVDAFNQGDAERISEFYSNNAIKHQVASSRVKWPDCISARILG